MAYPFYLVYCWDLEKNPYTKQFLGGFKAGLAMIMSNKIAALIAAAGSGTRSGLDYPKTLFPINGQSILSKIINLIAPIDPMPSIVASPVGKPLIQSHIASLDLSAHIVIKDRP